MSGENTADPTGLADARLSEIAVFTEDVPTTAAFYERILGPPGYADDSIAHFTVNGVEVLVHEAADGDDEHASLPAEDHFAFAVPDVDEAFETLSSEGLSAYREPADYEWGRSAYFTDPDGRFVEIAER